MNRKPRAKAESRELIFQSKQELVDFLSSNAFSFVNLDLVSEGARRVSLLAFDHNHKELIKLNDVRPSNKLIVEYSDNPSTQSCPSAFLLIVASVVWIPNATSARIKHPSSNKSCCASGFNCQFIVESDFEGAQAYNVAPDSINRRRRQVRRSTLIVVCAPAIAVAVGVFIATAVARGGSTVVATAAAAMPAAALPASCRCHRRHPRRRVLPPMTPPCCRAARCHRSATALPPPRRRAIAATALSPPPCCRAAHC